MLRGDHKWKKSFDKAEKDWNSSCENGNTSDINNFIKI
jgi:hypothetical protein